MSVYAVNSVARRLVRDPEFRARVKEAPAAALDGFDLSPDERTALLAGDVAALYELGVHDYLLMCFARYGVFGLDIPTFSERIRSAKLRLIY